MAGPLDVKRIATPIKKPGTISNKIKNKANKKSKVRFKINFKIQIQE